MITELILTFHAKGWDAEKIATRMPKWVTDTLSHEDIIKMINTCIADSEKESQS